MDDPPSPETETDAIPAPSDRKQTSRWQMGLRSLVLLMAVIAVWMTAYVNKREIERLDKRNQPMRPLARELKVDDASKFAIVRLEAVWLNDMRWDLYVPSGPYRFCLATRGIGNNGIAKLSTSAPIASGRHRIRLEVDEDENSTQFKVFCDDAKLLSFEESKDWRTLGWQSYENFSTSEQHPVDQPLAIYRRQYPKPEDRQSEIPSGSTNGILLWVEQSTTSNTPSRQPDPK